MTEPRPLTWDDLDQLADFTAGTLTGPDADRITHLIATDPRWTTAHTTLHHTEPTIRAALRAAADTTPPIPDHLTTTLDHALRTTAHDRPAPRASGRTRPRSAQPPSARPLPGRPAARPARRRHLLAGVAVLVLVASFGGALIRELLPGFTAEESGPAAELDDDSKVYPPWASAPRGALPTNLFASREPGAADASLTADSAGGGYDGPDLYSSGADYQPGTLSQLAAAPMGRSVRFWDAAVQSGALAPLNTPDGYSACAAAVLADHPGRVAYADFARYQGSPALVFVLRRPTGSTVVAVAQTCGVAGDPHQLAAAEVA